MIKSVKQHKHYFNTKEEHTTSLLYDVAQVPKCWEELTKYCEVLQAFVRLEL